MDLSRLDIRHLPFIQYMCDPLYVNGKGSFININKFQTLMKMNRIVLLGIVFSDILIEDIEIFLLIGSHFINI